MDEIFLLPEPSLWKKVGQDETPYEPYKSLEKLPYTLPFFIHRELEDCLPVIHMGGGLFEVRGHGRTLYNRHQLLAFYDSTVTRGPKPSVDPLTTLYVQQGVHVGKTLDKIITDSMTDEEWARIGTLEPEVPVTPVRVSPVATEPPPLEHKRRLFGLYVPEPRAPPPPHKNPFRKALHLPPILRVTYENRPAILTHQASKPFPDKAILELQFLDKSKEIVTFFGTTDEEDEDYEEFKFIRMNSSAPINLLTLLSYSSERIADETTDRWPQEEQEPEPVPVPAILERLLSKEAALQEELKGLEDAMKVYEHIKALEAQVQEALMYAPLDDEAALHEREQEAEAELARLECLTKRSKDLDIRIGEARMVWCYEELADGEKGLAKREAEAAEELAELEILQTKVTALRALEERVAEARKVLATV
jgi:hypothetical protein